MQIKQENHKKAGIIKVEEVQTLQNGFCSVTGVTMFCIDENGNRLTEVSGHEKDADILQYLIKEEQKVSILNNLILNSIEEQIVEETAYQDVLAAGVSCKVKGKPMLNWFVCAALADRAASAGTAGITRKVTEAEFYEVLNLIRMIGTRMLNFFVSSTSASEEILRQREKTHELNYALKSSKSMTEIVQFLDNDNSIEEIIAAILQIAGSHCGVSDAFVIGKNKNGFERVSRWQADETQKPILLEAFGKFIKLSEKVVVVSYPGREVNKDTLYYLKTEGIHALIVMPVYINGKAAMYTCFAERKQERVWSLEEIKFINDVSKVLQSIMTRRIQKNSLTSSYASLEKILNNVGSSIYVADIETKKVLFTNDALKENFDLSSSRDGLEYLLEQHVEAAQSQQIPVNAVEVYYKSKNRWYDLYHTTMEWVDGREVSLYALYDITDKKLYQQKIEQQANNDFLTGLYNRMCCERDLALYIQDAEETGHSGAILYLDLDDFKHINDGLGHKYGDVLLQAISSSMKRIEGIEETCYRVGGDEFVVIIPPNSYFHLEEIIYDIKQIFSKPWFLKETDYYCTMSMGVVKFPEDGNSVQDLIKKADIAMYSAKRGGKNRISRYISTEGANAGKRLDMEKYMREAMTKEFNEFEVYYQPLFDIQRDGHPCTGAEALIRWNSEQMGHISPADFIPLAEYLGLINPIGHHVLKKACFACKQWNQSGKPYFKVNVNLSVVQLLQNDVVEKIAEVLRETEINPRNLVLEVTESLAINDMDRMKDILHEIKKLGVGIALDDFGTGYSSLNHIRELPIDVIKIDQTFVADLGEDTYSQSFIKMVSELAEAIGVKICVEGIERKEQYKALEDLKVRLIQGYYFDPPMVLSDFDYKYVIGNMDEQ